MPELPDVEVFKRVLDTHARGRVVARVTVADSGSLEGASAATFAAPAEGQAPFGIAARWQGPVRRVSRTPRLLTCIFGTNGSLVGLSSDEGELPSTRLMFEFTGGARLAYLNPRRIGHVCVTASAASSTADQRLGPDALDPAFAPSLSIARTSCFWSSRRT
jgi:formamidopyrimidine-DNA glycosylase